MTVNAYVSTNGNDTDVYYTIATREVSVTNVTQASNGQVTTSTAHGLSPGDHIIFNNLGGMTQLNSTQPEYETRATKTVVVSVVDSTNFTISDNTTGYTAYTSGGVMRQPGATRYTEGSFTVAGAEDIFSVGQIFYCVGIGGMSQHNSTFYRVKAVRENSISIKDVDNGTDVNTSVYSAYNGTGGSLYIYDGFLITNITNANPAVVTANGHNFSNGDYIFINGQDVGDMEEVNGKSYKVQNVSGNTFELANSSGGIDSSVFGTFVDNENTFVREVYATIDAATNGSYSNVKIPYDFIRVEKTSGPTQYTAANCTWTKGSRTVSTSASLVGSIAVGNYISRSSTALDGDDETIYRVTAISSTTITLESNYVGTTGTDTSSIYKYPYATNMNRTTGTVIFYTRGQNIDGGWDVEDCTQDGTTLLGRGTRTSTSWYGIYFNTEGGSLNKINVVESYICAYVLNPNADITNCTFAGGGVYTIQCTSTHLTLDNVFINSNSNASYSSIRLSFGTGVSFNDVKVNSLGTSTAASAFQLSSGDYDFSGVTIDSCYGAGIEFEATSITVRNATIKNCYYGINSNTSKYNLVVDNCDFEGNFRAMYIGTLVNDIIIKNCSFTSNTGHAIYFTSTSNIEVNSCTFESNGEDVYLDQYSGSCKVINCSHTTPSTWAYESNYRAGNVTLINCSIDAPSLSKAYALTAIDQYVVPQYVLQNSFGKTGKIYGRGTIMKDSTITTPSGYDTVAVTFTTTVSALDIDWIVDSRYVSAGQAQDFNFYVRANGSWTGSIIPKLKLNGVTVTTLSAITSISNGSWDTHNITASAGSISEDGLLTLEFEFESNNTQLNFYTDDT